MIATLLIGLATGFVYALVAMGYSLVYRTTGIVNFTSGSFVVLGGLGTYWILTNTGVPYAVAVIGSLVLAAAVATVFWVMIVIPLWRQKSPDYIVLLSTVLVGALLAPLTDLLITPQAETLPPWINGFNLHLDGGTVSGQYILVMIAAIVVLVAVSVVLKFTIVGKQLRSVASDRDTSRLLGINPELIGGIALVTAAVVAALGGAMITPAQNTSSSLGLTYGIYAFVAAVFGGLSSVSGAFIGGVVLGVGQAFVDRYFTPNFDNIIIFGLLVVVLVIRPNGLLGKPASADR
jgi:branched-chain amino acid transport system permease protein